MKNLLLLVFFLSLSSVVVVRAATYNILDYGAREDNLSTAAIQKAVDICHEEGGGTVIVPLGRFIIGTVILKSNVNIYLEPGALLEGSKNLDDYIATFRKHGMFFSEDAENLSITGKGTIDAQGTHFPLLNQTFAIYAKSGKIIQFTKYRMIFHTLQQVLVERKITNSAKANSYLNREYRSSWRLDEI